MIEYLDFEDLFLGDDFVVGKSLLLYGLKRK